ncbi:hypothetical protein [Endozoicomonas sp. Mp262]|uniref:hypothetical protein n=1 Tax=Endozoicomonas sp. Mp262 TaxID=2919499 RepID=UPI0021E0BBBF
MNTDELVELIARRVMEQLLTYKKESISPATKESVLVVGDCAQREQLTMRLGNCFSLTFSVDREDTLDPADYDYIILGCLPNSLLSALAAGLERGNDGCIIVHSLLLGKTIHILEEGIDYHRYCDTAKPAFYRLFEQKEEILCSFGMKVVSLTNLKSVLSENNGAESEPNKPVSETIYEVKAPSPRKAINNNLHIMEQRVVGEKDLRACYEKGYRQLQLGQKTILTPLAKDFICMNNDLVLVRN